MNTSRLTCSGFILHAWYIFLSECRTTPNFYIINIQIIKIIMYYYVLLVYRWPVVKSTPPSPIYRRPVVKATPPSPIQTIGTQENKHITPVTSYQTLNMEYTFQTTHCLHMLDSYLEDFWVGGGTSRSYGWPGLLIGHHGRRFANNRDTFGPNRIRYMIILQ